MEKILPDVASLCREIRKISNAQISIAIEQSQVLLAQQTEVALTLSSRMIGLLRYSHLDTGKALLIPSCHSVHTWGMRFVIDVVFVDVTWRVVAIYANLAPWRLTPLVWKAHSVIELPAGTTQRENLLVGDRLQIVVR